MKLIEAILCADCEEIYSYRDFMFCPKCGSIASIPVTQYVPSLKRFVHENSDMCPYWYFDSDDVMEYREI